MTVKQVSHRGSVNFEFLWLVRNTNKLLGHYSLLSGRKTKQSYLS